MKFVISFLKEKYNENEFIGMLISTINSFYCLSNEPDDQLIVNFSCSDVFDEAKLDDFRKLRFLKLNKIQDEHLEQFYKEYLKINKAKLINDHFIGICYSSWFMRKINESFVLIENDIIQVIDLKIRKYFDFNINKLQLIQGETIDGKYNSNSLIMFIPNKINLQILEWQKETLLMNNYDCSFLWSGFNEFLNKQKDVIITENKMLYWHQLSKTDNEVELAHRSNILFQKEFINVLQGGANYEISNENLFNRATDKDFHPKSVEELDFLISLSEKYFYSLVHLSNKLGIAIFDEIKYKNQIQKYKNKWKILKNPK